MPFATASDIYKPSTVPDIHSLGYISAAELDQIARNNVAKDFVALEMLIRMQMGEDASSAGKLALQAELGVTVTFTDEVSDPKGEGLAT